MQRVEQYFRQNFIWPALDVVDPIVAVQIREKDLARSRTRHQSDSRPERHQRRARVCRGHCHALRTSRCYPAGRAVFFQAEIDRLPPFVALIVIIAARIQTDVSAERRHVSNLRSGHQRSRLRQRRQPIPKTRISSYFRESEACTDLQTGIAQLNFAQPLNVTQAHQRPRNLLPPFHVRQQVRAAREGHRTSPLAVQNARGFFERARCSEFEKRQPHHGASTFSFSRRRFCRRASSFTALPSPPSHGGGTRSASAQFTGGGWRGPTPRAPPPPLFATPVL